MPSPFTYDEPVDPGDLVGRRAELSLLTDRTLDGRNNRLEAPRRFGKTSVLRATLARAGHDGAITVEVNFLGCVTPADVADRIERAYARQLDSRLRRWLTSVVQTFSPTLELAPAGVGVSATLRAPSAALLDRLALPRRLHERTGRQCVIAFDEFQEVVRIHPALPGVFRSELETQGAAAAYVFSGSHPGLMRSLFADRRHAFFGQAAPVALGPLPADELGEFVSDRFEEGHRDPGEALGPLLRTAEGHPQRAMLLAHHLYERVRPRAAADAGDWQGALAAARVEASGELEVLWEASTELERRILKVVALRTLPLASREARERFGLAKGGSTQSAVDRLVADGHLVSDPATRTGVRVVDPLFEDWLRGER